MKKLLIVFLLTLFLVNTQNIFAQSASPSAKVIEINYDLPYPGILPDNPLYYLKAIRDNVLNLLITDPLKKAQYTLLMADKRLRSGQMLLDKHKDNLAITTLSKSGNYLFLAIRYANDAKKQGKDANPILNNIIQASKKHQQLLNEMSKNAKGDTKKNLINLEKRTGIFVNNAELLRSK